MTFNDGERDRARRMARVMYDEFYKCPTTARIIEALRGDDKVVCTCGRSNPAVPDERTEQTGTHLRRFLDRATVDDWIDQLQSDGILKTLAPQESEDK